MGLFVVEEEKKGAHNDAPRNIQSYLAWSKKQKWPSGLKARIQSSGSNSVEVAKSSYVMLSWQPPMGIKSPNFAHPVTFHQASFEFTVELENNYKLLARRAEEFWKKQQVQLNLEGCV